MVRVAFVHPDLGIGGAERAVIDIALALKCQGHLVSLFTSHHDRKHCFTETSDGTLSVTTIGDWLPRNICGRCFALCAYIRMVFVALYIIITARYNSYDVIFCDQISACIPLFRIFRPRWKIIFFCHFPDLLLTAREGYLKSLYRTPIDFVEERSTGLAHCVLVNSRFTAGVFYKTFKSLHKVETRILYPVTDFSKFDQLLENSVDDLIPEDVKIIFLSLNRFTKAKNHSLAIEALDNLYLKANLEERNIHLVITGGYDERVTENKETFITLQEMTRNLSLSDRVTFIKSCSDQHKAALMKKCSCLLYTPEHEHFGITPLEAMYMQRPVIAVNSGGPVETVQHEVTGFLCEPSPDAFSEAMLRFVKDNNLADKMGKAGYKRVTTVFSRRQFIDDVNKIVDDLCQR